MTTRRIGFEGPINFRDLGGYAVADGGHVRWGRLYRSDSLHTITAADAPMLRDLGVHTAIDFRSSDEIDKMGIGPLGEVSVRHVHCPTFDRVPTEAPPFEGKTAAEFYAHMMERGSGAYVAALQVDRRARRAARGVLLPRGQGPHRLLRGARAGPPRRVERRDRRRLRADSGDRARSSRSDGSFAMAPMLTPSAGRTSRRTCAGRTAT